MNNNESNDIVNNIAKLEWACRRGMLELDVLLGNFLKHAYPSLPLEDKKRFVRLLECSDPELFSWLMGQVQPSDKDLAAITEVIRRHARSGI